MIGISHSPGKTAIEAATSSAPSVVADQKIESVEAAAFCWLVIGLAWVPFWNGSNELAAWGINALLFAAAAFMCEVSVLIKGGVHPFGLRNIALPATLFGLVVFWVYIQTVARTGLPVADPIWKLASDALQKPVAGAISVDPDLTRFGLLRLITAALVFWSALQLCRNSLLANLLLKSITTIACAYAAYGVLALSVPGLRLPWLNDAGVAGQLSSTFISRNSFAAFAGLGLVTAAGLAAQLCRKEVARAGTRQLAIAAGIEAAGRKGAPLIGAIFLIMIALLLTGSRDGIAATVLGLFIIAVLTPKPGEPRSFTPTILIALASLTLGGFLFVFGDPIVANLADPESAGANRSSLYWLSLRSIWDRPILGHGYGTFVDVFPAYRDRSISVNGTWKQAYNTYLDVFQGLGLLFGSLLLLSVLQLAWRCIKGAMTRRENATIPRVAAAATLLVGVHSLVDVSLQIQAVALIFAALLGAGVAQAHSTRVTLAD